MEITGLPGPLSTRCSNDHRDDMWTCPACYTDLGDVGPGTATCPKCSHTMKLTLAKFTSCVAELIPDE